MRAEVWRTIPYPVLRISYDAPLGSSGDVKASCRSAQSEQSKMPVFILAYRNGLHRRQRYRHEMESFLKAHSS